MPRTSKKTLDPLAPLVKKAIGPREVKRFAEEANISYSLLHRVVNSARIRSIKRETLEKIADNAAPGSGVTIEDLIAANVALNIAPSTALENADLIVSDPEAWVHMTDNEILIETIDRLIEAHEDAIQKLKEKRASLL